jgi:hypothetical protein
VESGVLVSQLLQGAGGPSHRKAKVTALAEKHLPAARQALRPAQAGDEDDDEHSTRSDAALAKYLYEHGRCAIAHAHSSPLVDPDDVSTASPIARDVRLVRALATSVIEAEFGIPPRPPSDWRPEWSRVRWEAGRFIDEPGTRAAR